MILSFERNNPFELSNHQSIPVECSWKKKKKKLAQPSNHLPIECDHHKLINCIVFHHKLTLCYWYFVFFFSLEYTFNWLNITFGNIGILHCTMVDGASLPYISMCAKVSDTYRFILSHTSQIHIEHVWRSSRILKHRLASGKF